MPKVLSTVIAYIDPFAGSLLIQALIAAIATVSYFFRHKIGGVLARVFRFGRAPDAQGSEETGKDQENDDADR